MNMQTAQLIERSFFCLFVQNTHHAEIPDSNNRSDRNW